MVNSIQSKTIENQTSIKNENIARNELISTFKTLMATGNEENINLVKDLILAEKDVNEILKNFTKEEQEMLGLKVKIEITKGIEQNLSTESTKNIKTKTIDISNNKAQQLDSSSVKETNKYKNK